MTKEFIPYEQALELKELGFDEPCLAHRYSDRNDDFHFLPNPLNNSQLIKENRGWSTPTFSQAFRWFREKYNLHILINVKDGIWYFERFSINGFKTYEEAELACLNKLIEIVKTK